MYCFGTAYSGKLQPSQIVCTPRSSRCKIRSSRKTVCANDILAVILLVPCVIHLWDSAAAHWPSGKERNPSFQEDARFSGRCTLAYNFHFILRHRSLGLSNSSLTLPVKSLTLPYSANHVSQGLLLRDVLILS